MGTKNIGVFTQHYDTPDSSTSGRPYSMVKALSKDHRVTLIATNTADRSSRISRNFEWLPQGVQMKTVNAPYSNEMGMLRRAIAYAKYGIGALNAGIRGSSLDLIIGSSPPLSAALIASLVARWHNIPWIFEVRDLWPDFPIQMGAVPSDTMQRVLYGVERYLYRSADHVVALSPDISKHVRLHTDAVTTIPYGTNYELLQYASVDAVRVDLKVAKEARIVLYAGALGRANAIPTLMEAAIALEDKNRVRVVIAGDGYYATEVRRIANQHHHITYLPPQPYTHTLALFKLAHLSVVSFLDRPVLGTNSPAKLYDSLAAGTPVIVTNSGWMKKLVENHQCGWYVPSENVSALVQCIRKQLYHSDERARAAEQAKRVASTYLRRSNHMARYRRLVDRVVCGA